MNVATSIDRQFYELYMSFRIMPNTRGLGGVEGLGALGEFGEALGEIASLEAYSVKIIMDETREGLGELNELALTIDEAKAQLSQALNLKAQVASVRARFDRLTQKLSRAKNEVVRTRIQGILAKAKPLIDTAAAGAAGIEATIASMTDFLRQAGVVVEAAKEKVGQAAEAAKKGATEAIQKAKELALKAGQLVREKATAAGKIAKAALEAAKQKAVQAAQAAKKAASQKVAQAKALAQQAAARAKQAAQAAARAAAQRVAQVRAAAQATARAAAQRVQQAAAQARAIASQRAAQARRVATAVVQRARQTVAPAVQRVQQAVQSARAAPAAAVSRLKSFFGLRGLSEHRGLSGLGVAPVLLAAGAAAAVGGALLAANSLLSSGEAIPTDGEVPATIPMEDIEKYKDAAGECYNSAVAQGYDVSTKEKSENLVSVCRQRAAQQFAEQAQVPGFAPEPGYTPTGGEFTPAGYPSAEGGILEQMCATNPTNPQCKCLSEPWRPECSGIVPGGGQPIQLPEGGGYYTTGERPTIMSIPEYQEQQRAIQEGRAPAYEEQRYTPAEQRYTPGYTPSRAPGYEPEIPPEMAPGVPTEYTPTFEFPGVTSREPEVPTVPGAPTQVPGAPSLFEEFETISPFTAAPGYPEYAPTEQYPGVVQRPEEVEKIEEDYYFGDKFFDIFGEEQYKEQPQQTQTKKSIFDAISEIGI